MQTRTLLLSTLLLLPVANLTAAAATDSAESTPAGGSAPQPRWHQGHRGEYHRILAQLNLSGDQRTQIKSIMTQVKPQLLAQRDAARVTRDSLAATAPTDPNYPALVAAAQSNAASAVQLRSNVWGQIYAVLSPAQQAQVPEIVAQQKAERAARKAAWQGRSAAQ